MGISIALISQNIQWYVLWMLVLIGFWENNIKTILKLQCVWPLVWYVGNL